MSSQNQTHSQVTDAVTQTNMSVVAESPAQSLGVVYQSLAHALGMSMQNAVTAQNSMQQIGTSVVGAACAKIIEAGGLTVPVTDGQTNNPPPSPAGGNLPSAP